tara:strand:+ start:4815 stop:5519 length:705 start_codon:yes stop_codon:yes gene_type:complete
MIKKAIILSAGFGKRINPLTLDTPKPLLKIRNETLLSNTIKFLEFYGVDNVVINVHYLKEKIINYINKKNFKINITIVEEKNKILNTGGGVLNAINNFSNQPFLIVNPDTIWEDKYISELKLMEELFLKNKKAKCILLVAKKEKSFDKTLKGDFNIKNNLLNREKKNDLKYIFTGLQIIKPESFLGIGEKVFSMNKIWDNLIQNKELLGTISNIDFLHVSTLKIYEKLLNEIKI